MSDYSTGKIYKIVNGIDNEIYIGSTIQTLKKRLSDHRWLAGCAMKLVLHYDKIG